MKSPEFQSNILICIRDFLTIWTVFSLAWNHAGYKIKFKKVNKIGFVNALQFGFLKQAMK